MFFCVIIFTLIILVTKKNYQFNYFIENNVFNNFFMFVDSSTVNDLNSYLSTKRYLFIISYIYFLSSSLIFNFNESSTL